MNLTQKHCVPCEGGIFPLSQMEEEAYFQAIPGWQIEREDVHKISCQFVFKNFKEAMVFINKVADIAESEGHHPNIIVNYNKVSLVLFTHAIGGLSPNDFIIAAKVNAISV